MRSVDATYYGYMDDDDGLLIPSEDKCEKEAIRAKIEQWKTSESNDPMMEDGFVVPEMNVRTPFASHEHEKSFVFSRMTRTTWLADRRETTWTWHREIMCSSLTCLFPLRKM